MSVRLRSAALLLLVLLCAPSLSFSGPVHARRGSGLRHRSCVLSARDIERIEDTDSYHALIADATEQNRIVVIKFYASWCRACKAMAPKFVRTAEDWPDIEFHEILFDDNKKLCKVRRLAPPLLPSLSRHCHTRTSPLSSLTPCLVACLSSEPQLQDLAFYGDHRRDQGQGRGLYLRTQ